MNPTSQHIFFYKKSQTTIRLLYFINKTCCHVIFTSQLALFSHMKMTWQNHVAGEPFSCSACHALMPQYFSYLIIGFPCLDESFWWCILLMIVWLFCPNLQLSYVVLMRISIAMRNSFVVSWFICLWYVWCLKFLLSNVLKFVLIIRLLS